MTITIPWNDGPGNIVLTYTGQGNDTVVVTSDTDCIDRHLIPKITAQNYIKLTLSYIEYAFKIFLTS